MKRRGDGETEEMKRGGEKERVLKNRKQGKSNQGGVTGYGILNTGY